MQELKERTTPRLLDRAGLYAYVSAGRKTAESIADASGAKVKIGKRLLFDRMKIDAYIDSITGAEK